MKDSDRNILHIYGQETWHQDVFIVGTRSGLENIRDAVNAALEGKQGVAESFVNDGEGFNVIAILTEDDDTVKHLALPYIDPQMFPNRGEEEGEVNPSTLCDWKAYRAYQKLLEDKYKKD